VLSYSSESMYLVDLCRMRLVLFLFLVSSWTLLSASKPEKPVSIAKKVTASFDIDGQDLESAWSETAPLDQFTESNPSPGTPSSRRTEVKLLYSDDGIYAFAKMYESQDSVINRMTPRDNIRNTDWIGVILDPYKSGINGVGFIVTAAGVQLDTQYGSNGEDVGWNAVWQSKALVTDYGWCAEIFIPFQAVRFSEENFQDWGLNIGRYTESIRENSWWSEVDPNVDGFLNQAGQWKGLQDIKAPLRLTLFPFVATTLNVSDPSGPDNAQAVTGISGGADIKYGINEAFTLDMTLIPDFSQARSDNQVLNLSPFEVRFDEQRAFFQEGTELFQRGEIFFSRRIGNRLIFRNSAFNNLEPGEIITSSPQTSRLINISKVTGRTKGGTGLGLLNAISAATFATIENSEGESREVLLNPFTNYNVIVADQNLKNNSYVSLINTSVIRASGGYEANVTAIEGELRNKENSYAIEGLAAVSQQYYEAGTKRGHKMELGVGKISGKLTARINYEEIGRDYDQNDLGFQRVNNYRSIEVGASYRNFEPKSDKLNSFRHSFEMEYESLHEGWDYTDFSIFQNSFLLTKNFFAAGRFTFYKPAGEHDYFEPRAFDFEQYLDNPGFIVNGGFISTNYSKRFAIDVEGSHYTSFQKDRWGWDLSVRPRVRVLDNLLLQWNVSYNINHDDVGFINISPAGQSYDQIDPDGIFMSLRNREQVANTLTIDYSISPNLNINFRMRHFWSSVDIHDVFQLGEKGSLVDIPYDGTDINGDPLLDINFNAVNIDMVATWRFAPGSDLIFVWKDAIASGAQMLRPSYTKNFRDVWSQDHFHSFTVKAVYFLDYYTVTRGLRTSN